MGQAPDLSKLGGFDPRRFHPNGNPGLVGGAPGGPQAGGDGRVASAPPATERRGVDPDRAANLLRALAITYVHDDTEVALT